VECPLREGRLFVQRTRKDEPGSTCRKGSEPSSRFNGWLLHDEGKSRGRLGRAAGGGDRDGVSSHGCAGIRRRRVAAATASAAGREHDKSQGRQKKLKRAPLPRSADQHNRKERETSQGEPTRPMRMLGRLKHRHSRWHGRHGDRGGCRCRRTCSGNR
jgi:hypothetical protein